MTDKLDTVTALLCVETLVSSEHAFRNTRLRSVAVAFRIAAFRRAMVRTAGLWQTTFWQPWRTYCRNERHGFGCVLDCVSLRF